MPIVELPDGSEVEFPNGMNQSQIMNVINQHSMSGQVLSSILSPKALEPYRKVAGEIAADMIPVVSQKRSINRISEMKDKLGTGTVIGDALTSANIGLEALGLGADIVPGLKLGAAALGSLIPFMVRRVGNLSPLQKALKKELGSVGSVGDLPMDKVSRKARMMDNGLERGWYRGGVSPADSNWYTTDREYAKDFAKGDFREYALPSGLLGMNSPIPDEVLLKVADSAESAGDTVIAKEVRGAIESGEPLSFAELNMWFQNAGKTSVDEHFRNAGIEGVTDNTTAYMLKDNRVRDAKKAAYAPGRKLEKGLTLGIGGVLSADYLSDKERRQHQNL